MNRKKSARGQFSGKTILITGGASGMGLAMAKVFARSGGTILIVDNNVRLGREAIKTIKAETKSSCHFLKCDLTKEQSIKRLIQTIEKRFRGMDILINNCRCSQRTSLLEESYKTWITTTDAMLKASFFLAQYAVQGMKRRKAGIILNISSVLSQFVSHESPSYHATKSAVEGLTRYLAVHAAKFGVRVNGISPGFIVKSGHIERFYSEENEVFRTSALACHPLGKVGLEEDIAHIAEFLCSDKARFINGQTIVADGGLTIQEPFNLLHSFSKTLEDTKGDT